LEMPVRLVESNPLVEETRNQVAVMRGPIVYCLESKDLPANVRLQDVLLPLKNDLKPVATPTNIEGSPIQFLEGQVLVQKRADWSHELYREVTLQTTPIVARFIPYYAWGNRGRTEMSVWMPVNR